MPDVWRPQVYEHFARERRQPFEDLLALVEPRAGMSVVDLGCGTGALTAELHQRLGARATLGLDRSARMLEGAATLHAEGLRFAQDEVADFAARATERYDLIFSNAALHWVPNHERLFVDLARLVADGGQLAVQVPANHTQVPAITAVEVAREAPFVEALHGAVDERPLLSLERYAALLYELGFARQHVRLQLYAHPLASREAVVDWVRGTALTWCEERLGEQLFAAYLARYRQRLFEQLEDRRPFLFTFRRLLMWGARR